MKQVTVLIGNEYSASVYFSVTRIRRKRIYSIVLVQSRLILCSFAFLTVHFVTIGSTFFNPVFSVTAFSAWQFHSCVCRTGYKGPHAQCWGVSMIHVS